jgi:hypothetical protein
MTGPPETHYARSSDVCIAYQVTGEWTCPGLVDTLS